MCPIVDGLGQLYEEQITFIDADAVGDGRAAFEAADLPGHPSYLLFDADGRERWRGFGVLPRDDIERALAAATTP